MYIASKGETFKLKNLCGQIKPNFIVPINIILLQLVGG